MIKYDKINDANNFLKKFGLEYSVKTGGANKAEDLLFVNKEPNNMWSIKIEKNDIYFMDSSLFLKTVENVEKKLKYKLFK